MLWLKVKFRPALVRHFSVIVCCCRKLNIGHKVNAQIRILKRSLNDIFKLKKVFVKNPGAHFTLQISTNLLNYLRRFPYLLFWREIYPQTFCPEFLSICEYNSWKKTACHRPLKNQHFDRKYMENDTRNIYSNYNRIRAYAECSPNQSKKLYLIDISIEQLTKLWGFWNSAGRFCISSLPEYCSSSLIAQAYYKMVITTVCVQIDNCFCHTWIVVHLCVSLRWFRGTLF